MNALIARPWLARQKRRLDHDAPRTRVARRPVHGVLLLDKPLGLSSNDALQKAKWLLRAEKAGHTGTLDPLATGVLPLCFGAATKFSQLQLDADKTYEAVLAGRHHHHRRCRGRGDRARPVPDITPERLAAVRLQFTGPSARCRPMHSALKKDGKALYEYARAGIEVERAPRDVTIHALNLALRRWKSAAAIKMIVKCSKGTYIRTLGEDIGEALGCGAHLTRLRRMAPGGLAWRAASRWSALEAMTKRAPGLPGAARSAAGRSHAVTLDATMRARS
jgi:tRNA pseudouridine55 synthase